MAGEFLPQFTTAERKRCKASIMLEGLSGHGKTGVALYIAFILANKAWDKVFVIDTEKGSASLFAGLTIPTGDKIANFKKVELTDSIGYRPSYYLRLREAAIQAGAEVVINDSCSHAWQYAGGVLDMVAEKKATNTRYEKDSYAAWGDANIVKEKNNIPLIIRDERVHVISTVRVKEKLEYVKNAEGKNELQSLGEQQIQQGDLKYEPDLVLHLLSPARVTAEGKVIDYPVARVVKTRYAIFNLDQEYTLTPELLLQLKAYLEEGVAPEELAETQRKEILIKIKDIVKANPARQAIIDLIKEQLGFEKIPVKDLPLDVLRNLIITLTKE